MPKSINTSQDVYISKACRLALILDVAFPPSTPERLRQRPCKISIAVPPAPSMLLSRFKRKRKYARCLERHSREDVANCCSLYEREAMLLCTKFSLLCAIRPIAIRYIQFVQKSAARCIDYNMRVKTFYLHGHYSYV